MAKVVFDPAHFKEIYPQFAGISDTQLEWFFKKSEQILDNSENSCIDEDTRLIWFYLLVAHYAQLQTQIQSGNSAVGRISSATEGSVSVSLDYPTSAVGREKWFKYIGFCILFHATAIVTNRKHDIFTWQSFKIRGTI